MDIIKIDPKVQSLRHSSWQQGDQIGRIFDYWVTVYFGQFFRKLQKQTIFLGNFFHG
jgi:hypothetical protein